MQEVSPRKVQAPKTESILRVGIVLAEDKKQELYLTPQTNYIEASTGFKLLANVKYKAKIDDSLIQIQTEQGLIRNSILKLDPENNSKDSAIKFEDIVAGRSFHWKKNIEQIIPASFELHQDKGNLVLVNIVNFELYLACVITSEMGQECPKDFAKAQAVAARSWAQVFIEDKHSNQAYTICNDDCCQRYQGTTHLDQRSFAYISECAGEFLVNDEEHITPAYYSKCCGGKSELAENSLGINCKDLKSISDSKENIPSLADEKTFSAFLKQEHDIFCSEINFPKSDYSKYLGHVDESGSYFRWTKTIEISDLCQRLDPKLNSITAINIIKRGVSGRILNLEILGRDTNNQEVKLELKSQYSIREKLCSKFLYSSAFIIEASTDLNSKLVLSGAGWGHGVGLCQMGALGMALKGFDYKEILLHYFPESKLIKTY